MENLTEILKKEPLSLRCQLLSDALSTLPVRQLHLFLPNLLAHIFGYDNTPGWKIASLHSKWHPTDFNAVRQFLKPNGGPLFKALQCLECDSSSHFLFPFTAIPPHSAAGLMEGALSGPYRLFIDVDLEAKELNMTAHHYYFMYFAHFLIHPPPDISWPSDLSDVLYPQLVDEYMSYFMPPGCPIPSYSSPTLSKYVPHTTSLSQVFAEILIEMWLNQRSTDTLNNQVTLTLDQVRIVRMLVKHTHRFLYTPHLVKDRHTEEVASYISASFQINAVDFLHYHFATWPLIGSFRGLLETWLSYIQPWRYTSATPGSLTAANMEEWQGFVRENLPAYCALLDRCLRRMSHSYICFGRNIALLSRLLKIFSQEPLLCMLKDMEEPGGVFSGGAAAQELLDKLSGEIDNLERQLSTPSTPSTSLISSFNNWVSEGLWGPSQQEEQQQKTLGSLKSAVEQLEQIFSVTRLSEAAPPIDASLPDYAYDALHRRRLTPQGKNKLLAGAMKCDVKEVTMECNPALRPISSHENPHLVRYLYKASLSISAKWCSQLELLYRHNGPLAAIIKSLVIRVKEDVSEEGALMINLRPIASYRFISYSSLIIFISYMSGISPLLVFTYLGLGMAVCALGCVVISS